jgi:hypothetical protein
MLKVLDTSRLERLEQYWLVLNWYAMIARDLVQAGELFHFIHGDLE